MKTLSDGIEVSARSYYFLLDWNESNCWKYMYDNFQCKRLCDLNIVQYKQLFERAVMYELKSMI